MAYPASFPVINQSAQNYNFIFKHFHSCNKKQNARHIGEQNILYSKPVLTDINCRF